MITGDISAVVVEAGGINNASLNINTASGALSSSDVDGVDDRFASATSSPTYGTAAISPDGQWTYTLDNTLTDIDQLNDGQSLTDSFVATAEDGTSQVISITINGVNDLPSVNTLANADSYIEGMAAVLLQPALVLSDVDNTMLTGATVTISNHLVGDQLSFMSEAGISGSFDEGTGVLTFSGVAPLSDYQSVLRTVSLSSNSTDPTENGERTSRNFEFAIHDGNALGLSGVGTSSLALAGLNSAPTLDDTPLEVYAQAGASTPTGAVGVLLSTLVGGMTDVDAYALSGVAITSASTSLGTWYFSLNNGDNWSAVGSVSSSNALLLAADHQTRLFFQASNTVDNGTYSDQLTFLAWDQTTGSAGSTVNPVSSGVSSAFSTSSDTIALVVAPMNNAPLLLPGAGITYSEQAVAQPIAPGLSLVDLDPGERLASATVSLSADQLSVGDTLAIASDHLLSGVSATFDASTGVLSLLSAPDVPASVADYQAMLRAVTFANTTNDDPTAISATRMVTFSVTDTNVKNADNGPQTTTAFTTISIAALNDAPTLSGFSSAVASTTEDTTVQISFAELASFGDQSDVDGSVTGFKVGSLSSGTLRIGSSAATATSWNPASNDVVDSTRNLYWTPATNSNGILDAFTVVAKDHQGALSSLPQQVQVDVFAVNDAPIATGSVVSLTTLSEDAQLLPGDVYVDRSDLQSYVLATDHEVGNHYINAALKQDGSVVAWGEPAAWGGDISAVQNDLQSGVVQIFASTYALAALKDDGSVVAWGNVDNGGDNSLVASFVVDVDSPSFVPVQNIYSGQGVFVALREDGSVVSWGNPSLGGDTSFISDALTSGVVDIVSSGSSFAALKDDGTVVSWGSSETGGDSSSVSSALYGVQELFTTGNAFAALRADGSLVTWGHSWYGGDSSSVASLLTDQGDGQFSPVQRVFRGGGGFAALRADGSLVTWGHSAYGGDSSSVASALSHDSGIVEVVGADRAFAALMGNGSVVAWGDASLGGSIASVSSDLAFGVQKIFTTGSSFAALKADGSVVTWGYPEYGGDSTSVASLLTNSGDGSYVPVDTIVANQRAFVALKEDGSTVAWGMPSNGGDSSITHTDVELIVPTLTGFTALKDDGSVVTWGGTASGFDAVQGELSSGVVSLADPYHYDVRYQVVSQDVFSLLSANYSDELDQVAGGSSAAPIAGIAVTGYARNATQGEWQYFEANSGQWISIDAIDSPTQALTLSSSDQIRFSPNPDFFGNPPNLIVALIDDSMAVTSGATVDASDRGGTTAYSSSTLSLTQFVTPIADIVADDFVIPEDGASGERDLLANDLFSGTPSSLTLVEDVNHGTLTWSADGRFSYTPDSDFNGTDTFSYVITSGGADESATVTISVEPVNDAPIATGDSSLASINEDAASIVGASVNALFSANFSDATDGGGSLSDFSTTVDGWSNGQLSTSSAWGSFLGRYTTQTISKNFDLNGSPATIEFDFLRIDSWDGEYFKVRSGSTDILSYRFSHGGTSSSVLGYGATTPVSGTTTIAGEGTYSWTITPLDYGSGSSMGAGSSSWNDQKFHISITTPSGLNALDLRMTSTLNQAVSDESWGIDNFSLTRASDGVGPEGHYLEAVAIISNPTISEGHWQISSDGIAWSDLPIDVTAANAFVATKSDQLRFQPAEHYNGPAPSLEVVLIDGGSDITYGSGTRLDVSTRGGSTAYSSDSVQLMHAVNPINDVPTLTVTSLAGTYSENDSILLP